jgi:hypothetical protein
MIDVIEPVRDGRAGSAAPAGLCGPVALSLAAATALLTAFGVIEARST